MAEKMRIYVGGLGEGVKEEDLRKTFSTPQLGVVESIEIIRTKGRSFAYLDFLPASDKALAKLFSNYNGCMWKGGKLRLEKAKEHYLLRLKREWVEDAAVAAAELSRQNVDATNNEHSIEKPKKDPDIDKKELRIFFPKLGKVKSIPFKGTGKHKYSFQHVEVSRLPIYFCDCEEHSVTLNAKKKDDHIDHEPQSFEVNEEERNMMQSILNKVLQRENGRRTISDQPEPTMNANDLPTSLDNLQTERNEEDQASDEDNLILNLVSGPSSVGSSFRRGMATTRQREKGRRTISDKPEATMNANYLPTLLDDLQTVPNEEDQASDEDNLILNLVSGPSSMGSSFRQGMAGTRQNSTSEEPRTSSNRNTQAIIHGGQKGKIVPTNKKRKTSLDEAEGGNHVKPFKRRASQQTNANHLPTTVEPPPFKNKESSLVQSGTDSTRSQKSSWRNLVSEKSNTSFNISDIIAGSHPEVELQSNSEDLSPHSGSDKDKQEKQDNQVEERAKLADAMADKPNNDVEKSSRGAAWLQKSSWTQLVSDTSSSQFSIAQILPGVTLEKKELPQSGVIDFSGSRKSEEKKLSGKDSSYSKEHLNKSQGNGKQISGGRVGSRANASTKKEQNNASSNSNQASSDTKYMAEKENSPSNSMPVNELPLASDRASLRNILSRDTCSFMRNADSVKEWRKAKAALTSLKKKEKQADNE